MILGRIGSTLGQKLALPKLLINMREECACVVSDPASSPPWKPSVGLVCMHC